MDLKDEIMELINKGCDVRFSPMGKERCSIQVSANQWAAEKVLNVDDNCYVDEMPIVVNELTEKVLMRLNEAL